MNKKLMSLASVVVGFLPVAAMAQLTGTPTPPGTAQGDLASVILNIINYVLAIVGVIALAYLIFGGFKYITAGGNEDSVDDAKAIIRNAIIGIIVIGVAAAAVNFVIRGVGGNVPSGAI